MNELISKVGIELLGQLKINIANPFQEQRVGVCFALRVENDEQQRGFSWVGPIPQLSASAYQCNAMAGQQLATWTFKQTFYNCFHFINCQSLS